MPLIVFPLPFTKMIDTDNMNMNMSTNENMTTGQRIVREAMEPEEVQLAQITLNGGYVYDVSWLPHEELVRIETGVDRNGEPNYLWYPGSRTIGATLARVIGCQEEKILTWGIKVYSESGVTDALHYETRRFNQSTWHDYASEGYALQFQVQVRCDHDEGDVECSADSCGKGMTETAFRAQLAKVIAQNDALESLKQYTSDAEAEPDEQDTKTEAEAAAWAEACAWGERRAAVDDDEEEDDEKTEPASEPEAETEAETEPEKAAILAAAQAMWRRWAENEAAPEEARAMWQRWAENEATPELEPLPEPELEPAPEADDEAEEMALKEDAALDYIEERLRYLIIFLLGFVVAMLLVSLNEVYKTYTY